MEQIQKTRPLPEQISPPAMPATGQQSNSKPNQVSLHYFIQLNIPNFQFISLKSMQKEVSISNKIFFTSIIE